MVWRVLLFWVAFSSGSVVVPVLPSVVWRVWLFWVAFSRPVLWMGFVVAPFLPPDGVEGVAVTATHPDQAPG